MADVHNPSELEPPRRIATTPEGRENQLVAAAIDLAERQIIEGTVSAQVLTHYLKLGTRREELEREKLRRENLLLESKVNQIESGAKIEELYKEAITAMNQYAGREVVEEIDED